MSALLLILLLFGQTEQKSYDLAGQIVPETRASVSLFGAITPFSTAALADTRGRFEFRRLQPGTYTVAVFVPGRGEARQTIEVGPSLADSKGRVSVTIDLRDPKLVSEAVLRRQNLITARELTVPDRARREYADAQKKLSRHDVAGAIAHLQKAVQIAPQFAAAWNNLGTIAYQSKDFALAENHFREALEQDAEAYEPLVNLGGALLSLEKVDEALKYNLYAVLVRPNDALANSQLGMSYFYLGDLDRASKYLSTAKSLDPAHFSHPQLLLAEIHVRRKNPAAAADELEDFLRRHPDWTAAGKMREAIAKLRQ